MLRIRELCEVRHAMTGFAKRANRRKEAQVAECLGSGDIKLQTNRLGRLIVSIPGEKKVSLIIMTIIPQTSCVVKDWNPVACVAELCQ